MITTIKISHYDIEFIGKELKANKPYEACGMLIGTIVDTTAVIDRVMPMCKTNRSKLSFELEPSDFRIAQKDAEKNGKKIVGIYHTHPKAPAILSSGDKFGLKRFPLVWLVAGIDGVNAYVWDNGVKAVMMQEY